MALAEHYPELFGDTVVGAALIVHHGGRPATPAGSCSRCCRSGLGGRFIGPCRAHPRPRPPGRRRRPAPGATPSPTSSPTATRSVTATTYPPSKVEFVYSMLDATPFAVVADFYPAFAPLDKFEHLEPLGRVPTSIICGTEDKITSVGHSRKLHAGIPGSSLLECEGAGHMVILERHDQVNAELDDLISARPRARACCERRRTPGGARGGRRRPRGRPGGLRRPSRPGPTGRRARRGHRVRRAPAAPGAAACSPSSTAGRSAASAARPRRPTARAPPVRRRRPPPRAAAWPRALVDAAAGGGDRSVARLRVVAREELPGTVALLDRTASSDRPPGRAPTSSLATDPRARASTSPTPRRCASSASRRAGSGAGDLVMLTGDLGAGKTTLHPGARRGARRPRARHLADVRDRPRAPVPGRRARARPRRRLPARRARRARRPRPRHLARRRGDRRGVGRGPRRGAGRLAPRGRDRADRR